MRVAVCFQLKKSRSRLDGKCPLYVRCTYNGQRFEFSTNFFILSEMWNDSSQQVIGRTEDVKILNNRLDKIVSKIQDIYNQLESVGEPFDVISIKNKFLGRSNERGLLEVFDIVVQNVENKLGKDFSYGTLKHYRTSRRRLEEFIRKYTKKSDVALSKVDFSFINAFDVFLKAEKGALPNTALWYHKHVKKTFNTAIALGYITRSPYSSFKPTRNETHRDFLTLQELRVIQSKEIKVSRLDLVRDIFVFACYTGLSYSDIAKLDSSHIRKGSDGNVWIIINRTKTESRCRIPLLPIANDVLKKYGNHPAASSADRLLPVYSDQKMNSYLKEIATICGILKNLTMHVARHTFATSVTLSNGVPIETVSKMLGHSSLKTTQIYAKIVDSKISNDMNQLLIKLGNVPI